jgi:single-stranded-DNA-specific exonuclease
VAALRDAWCDAYRASPPEGGAEHGDADVRLDDRDDLGAVVRDLHRLEPCGEKNRAPRLLVPGVRVLSARNLKGHLRVELGWGAGGRSALGGFGFELGELAEGLIGGYADVVGQLRADTWKGGEAVELRVERIVRV